MIQLNAAQRLYGKNKQKGLLPTDLTIPTGQVVGVLGENGAGKSTLLKMIGGLTHLTGGEILIDGQKAPLTSGDIVYISGEGTYFGYCTPTGYGEFLAGLLPNFDSSRYAKLCQFFELDGEQTIDRMSTGQRTKVEVAAGLARRASYILMDEPFLGKDMFTRQDFLKLLAGSLRGGETLLITTHSVEEIAPFLDRALVLHKGRVMADRLMDELAEEGQTLPGLLAQSCGYDPARWRALFDEE